MYSRNQLTALVVLIASITGYAHGAAILCGKAILTMEEGRANSIGEFNAYFDDATERDHTLSDPAPGNSPFTEIPPAPATISLEDPIRRFGEVPSPYPGTPGQTRSRQITTLNIDPIDVLGSWSTSNDDFAFVGNTSLGEQIAFTSMQRWTGIFTGVLIYGDFGLRYTGSKLVLTSNIDFTSAAFAEIGNAQISANDETLSITGQLLTGPGLFVLDPSATPGTYFGEIDLTAVLTPRGDYNFDGVVDAADYVIWRKTDGAPAGYELWRANFGRLASCGPSSNSPAATAIPEPTTNLMILMGLFCGSSRLLRAKKSGYFSA